MKLGFIFSLPRAGSTYTQRVLSAATGVRTTSEPWLMPALLGIRYGTAPHADFAYDHVRKGLDGMLKSLPDPEGAWRHAVRAMAEDIYGNFAGPDELFIDKTPRNAVFAKEIIQTFPEARCLFLWRNPLSVANSINETWGGGHWKTYFYEYDLYAGLESLVATWQAAKANPNIKAIRYEDLVRSPDTHWPEVFAHFGLEYRAEYVARPPKIAVAMGDQSGQAKYSETSSASVDSWEKGFDTELRKRWARKYLRHIGAERLAVMGYELDELLARLEAAPSRFRASDLPRILLSPAYHRLDTYILRDNWLGRHSRRFSRR